MKRLIIFAVIGLTIGLAGGTGMSYAAGHRAAAKLAKAHRAAEADSIARADSVASVASAARTENISRADSAQRAAVADSARAPLNAKAGDTTDTAATGTGQRITRRAAGDSAGRRATPIADAGPAAPQGKPGLHTGTPSGIVTAVVPRDTTRGVDTIRVDRLARLFAAMPARDAAKVLLQLDDNDAQLVLSAMDNRHAAEVLSNFPPERAAVMSRLTLRPPRR